MNHPLSKSMAVLAALCLVAGGVAAAPAEARDIYYQTKRDTTYAYRYPKSGNAPGLLTALKREYVGEVITAQDTLLLPEGHYVKAVRSINVALSDKPGAAAEEIVYVFVESPGVRYLFPKAGRKFVNGYGWVRKSNLTRFHGNPKTGERYTVLYEILLKDGRSFPKVQYQEEPGHIRITGNRFGGAYSFRVSRSEIRSMTPLE